MFLRVHVVRSRDGKEVVEEELVNFDHVVRIAHCTDAGLANSYIFFQDQPTWTCYKVTETMDELYSLP